MNPSILQPAKKLEWNISPESARDIETAKKNLDRYGKDQWSRIIAILKVYIIAWVQKILLCIEPHHFLFMVELTTM